MTSSEINDFVGKEMWLVTHDKRIIGGMIATSTFNGLIFVQQSPGVYANWAVPNVNVFKTKAEAEFVVAMRGV